MTAPACPTVVELALLRDGHLTDAAILSHVDGCPACRERLAELDETDAFLHATALRMRTVGLAPNAEREAPVPSLDGYDVGEEVERGGQGVVYRAWHRRSARVVALKVVRVDSSRGRARIEREARLAARLRHPNIVAVHDCGELVDGRFAIAMEWVDGVDLERWASQVRGRADESALARRGRILRLFIALCDAIEHAHRNGVIHRDLKPQNILVDAEGQPHLVDFGIATAMDEGLRTRVTMTGEVACTLAYAAPEQLDGDARSVDTRSDVYSLGVLLFQLLTDRLPFESERGVADLFRQITQDDPPAPSRCRAASDASRDDIPIPLDLDTIVGKALARDPDRRYASALSLGNDVRRFLAGEPIDARRDSIGYLVGMTLRRHRMGVLLGGIALVALLVATSVTVLSVIARRESTIREEAERERMEGEAQRSAAVTEVLREVIPAGNPVPLAAATSDANRVVNAISENLEMGLFADDPGAVAATRLALAEVSADRGALRRAEVEYRQTLRVLRERQRSATAGADDVLASTVMTRLASLLARRSSFDEADRLIEEATPILERLLGPAHHDTLEALAVRAEISLAQGRVDEAIATLDELVRRNVAGDQRLVARESEVRLRALGATGAAGERAAVSLRLVRAVLRAYGDGDIRLFRALEALAANGDEPARSVAAALCESLRGTQLALLEPEAIERLVALKRLVFGPDDSDLVESQVRVAQRYLEQHRFDAARAPADDAVRIAIPTGIPSTVGELDLLYLRFRAWSLSSESDRAFDHLEETLAVARRLLGKGAEVHLITRLREFAFGAAWSGKVELARQLYGEAIERATTLSPTGPHLAWTEIEASRIEVRLGDAARGLPLVDAGIAGLRNTDQSWSWHRAVGTAVRGELLSVLGRHAEAVSALDEARRQMRAADLPPLDQQSAVEALDQMLEHAKAGRPVPLSL